MFKDNIILGKTCKSLRVKSFVNLMLDLDINEVLRLSNNFPFEDFSIEINPSEDNVPKRYTVKIVYGNGIKENNKIWLFCDTETSFDADLQREILTKDDFPYGDFMGLLCEAAAHTRVHLQQLTLGSPFQGMLIGISWGKFPQYLHESFLKLLRNQLGNC